MRRGWLALAAVTAAIAAAPAGMLKLTRYRAGSAQTHTFELRGVKYRMSRRLGVGTVRAKLPGGGRIALRWRASGGGRTVAYGRGCEGHRRLRDGRLSGVLRLPLVHDYFGTVVRRHLRGRAEQKVGVHCAAVAPRPPELSLRALYVDAGRRLLVHAVREPDGSARFTFAYEGGDVAGVHRIHLRGGSLSAATDLSAGKLVGGGPFVSGRLAFTALTPDSSTPGLTRGGRLDGGLTVRFDGLTPVTIRTLGGATLRLR
jgi:hypothetical protein